MEPQENLKIKHLWHTAVIVDGRMPASNLNVVHRERIEIAVFVGWFTLLGKISRAKHWTIEIKARKISGSVTKLFIQSTNQSSLFFFCLYAQTGDGEKKAASPCIHVSKHKKEDNCCMEGSHKTISIYKKEIIKLVQHTYVSHLPTLLRL